MIRQNFAFAIRRLRNSTYYNIINLFGLSVGLCVFFLAISLKQHEKNHDTFFKDAENIYGVYTRILPGAGFGTNRVYGSPPIAASFVRSNMNGIEAFSRYIENKIAVRTEQTSYFESIKFVDPEFTEIFNFQFLSGDPLSALQEKSGLVLTREAALKYFGTIEVVGELIRVGGRVDLTVTGVIENLPANSHFVYRFGTADRLQVIAPISVLEALGRDRMMKDWGAVSDRYRLWLKLSPETNPEQIEKSITEFLKPHINDRGKQIIDSFSLRGLTEWNLSALDANGISLASVIIVLSGIVLFVASLNYSNLFTALVARRLRELAVRKTLGANQIQLSCQLFMESLLLTSMASALSWLAVSAALPVFGALVGKEIALENLISSNLVSTVVLVVLATSTLSVSYPIYTIMRLATANALKGQVNRGRFKLRSSLVMVQFSVNSILAILMATSFLQNQHLLSADPGFNSKDVVILSGVNNAEVLERRDTFSNQLRAIPGVLKVSGSSQHPFQEIHNRASFSLNKAQTTETFSMYQMSVGENFFELYEIDRVAGRDFQRNMDEQSAGDSGSVINVIVNRRAISLLDHDSPAEAIGTVFFPGNIDSPEESYRVVGVVDDANLLGLANSIKPFIFKLQPERFSSLSVRLDSNAMAQAILDINQKWQELFPEIPVQSAFLQETFKARFNVFAAISRVLIGLSIVSILLAVFGLYGLISLMTQQRKSEIAVRKVLGATLASLLKLLTWRFTKPIGLALLIGTPFGVYASNQYLSLFSEQIGGSGLIGLAVSTFILAIAWLTVSGEVLRVSNRSPSLDLRCE